MTEHSSPEFGRPAWLPAWLTNAWGWATLGAAAYTGLYVLWTIFHWGGAENITLIADTTYLPISLFPALIAGRVVFERRLNPRVRRAWLLFTLAFLGQFIGNAIWLYLEFAAPAIPFPSSADIFYLAFFPLLLGGLLLLPHAPLVRGERLRFWMDLGTVVSVAAVAVWHFVIAPTLAGYPDDPLSRWLAAAYPIGDVVVLLGGLAVLFRRAAPETRGALGFFILGLIGFLASDLAYGYQALNATYRSGYWADVGWWLGLMLFGFAAARQLTPGPASRGERWIIWGEERLSDLLPLAAVAGMYGLVAYVAVTGTAGALPLMLAGAVLATLLVLIRQLAPWSWETELDEHPPDAPDAAAMAARARTARWAAVIFALAFLAGGGSLVARVLTGTAPPLWWVTVTADSVAALAALIGLGLIQRGRVTVGMGLVLAAGLGVILVTASQTAGLGVLLAVVTVAVVSAVAALTLTRRWASLAIVAGIFTAVLAVLIDLFGPADRPQDITFGYTLTISGALLAIYGFFLLRQFRTFSLRAKLIITSVATTVLTVGAVAALGGWAVQREVERQVGLNLQGIARAQGVAIGDVLDKETDSLQTLGLNPLLRDSLKAANRLYPNDPAAIQTQLAELNQQWRLAPATDPLIQAVINYRAALELRRFRQMAPENVELFITDRYGAVVAATYRPPAYAWAETAWWQAAYDQGRGQVFIGQPELEASTNTYGLALAVPVFSDDGREVVGVLRTTYDLSGLIKVLTSATMGLAGHTDILLPASGLISMEHAAGAFNAAVRAQLAAIPAGGYSTIVLNREPHLISQAPVVTMDPQTNAFVSALGWTIIADQDAAEALQPVQATTRLFVLVGLGALLVAGLLALAVAQALAGPITRLTAVAARVAAGDLEARAQIEAADETGLLASTFNSMTTQLQETLAGLETRVADRTRDLGLAAEVGQQLSAVRELDALLAEAVESIRSRFELYYTQIYLLDPAGRTLVLRAGTGAVGAQLKQRNFRLPVGPASINGTAVLERRPVIVADTAHSALFRPNALLPETRSEMAVPLLAGDHVVGVLDMQSAQPNALSEDTLPAFTTLAGQLTIAIENARLFRQAEQARREIEAQAQRLTHTGWADFLNAVDRPEAVTALYEGGPAAAQPPHVLAVPITIAGQAVGELAVEGEHDWTDAERGLVRTVAQRVAQQVENMRLLAQAQAYRAEAEEALRRLTRVGWRDYAEIAGRFGAFEYRDGQVQPAGEAPLAGDTVARPLLVQGEAIGTLTVAGAALPPEAEALLAAVAAQLSAHIENLRLGEATQLALAQTEELYRLTARLNSAGSLTEIVGIVAALDAAEAGALFLVEAGGVRQRACWPADLAPETFQTPAASSALATLGDDKRPASGPVLVGDQDYGRAAAYLPLTLAGQRVGLLVLTWPRARHFTQQDVQLYRAVAAQTAVVVNSRVLFDQTRQRADREAVINAINQKIQGTLTVEAALQTTAQELGRLLKVSQAVVRLGNGDGQPPQSNGQT